jgi:hypothetical protein
MPSLVAGKGEASLTHPLSLPIPFLLQTLPPQPSDFPASHKAILLNISKKYSLTPSLFIYKNQLNTLLLCSIWELEQPGLYLAEILLLSPQIPAQPDEPKGATEGGGAGAGPGGKGASRRVFCRTRFHLSPKDLEGWEVRSPPTTSAWPAGQRSSSTRLSICLVTLQFHSDAHRRTGRGESHTEQKDPSPNLQPAPGGSIKGALGLWSWVRG